MPYYARLSCPMCRAQFQTPVEQILDVRVDPNVKGRLLSGSVNVAVCPSCGMGGSLNMPFVYHDPEKEIALLYLPIESGKTEVERQRHAGALTRQLMDALPVEERKGYLFQPETFINMETLVRRVLELEGVTDADMQRSQAQRAFLDTLLQAEPEQWETLLAENGAFVDESFFAVLDYTLRVVAQLGPESEDFQKVQTLQGFLVARTAVGQALGRRSEVVRPFMDNPTRETLLAALLDAPDDATVDMLVQSGMPLMDYAFFQALLKRVQEAGSLEEKERMVALRRRILDLREEFMAASQAVSEERLFLLEKMLDAEDVLKMARSHLSEMDETFMAVLQQQLREAEQAGDREYLEQLSRVVQVVNQLTEESMPPELVLVRRLMMASDEQVRELLQHNRELLQAPFFEFLQGLEAESRERGDAQAAERFAHVLAIARSLAPGAAPGAALEAAPTPAEPAPSRSLDDLLRGASDAPQTPSGLIIAKR